MFVKETLPRLPLIELLWPERSLVRNVVLVFGTSLLFAFSAQIVLPLPFSPVPVTAQTLIALLSGAVLGSRLGPLIVLVYLIEGIVGLPFFVKGGAGLAYFQGVTGGYLIGFVVVTFVVGFLVERGWGRSFRTAVLAMLVGNMVLYCFGVPWLKNVLNISLGKALAIGFYVFIPGDLYKLGFASVLLPRLWSFFGKPKDY